MRILIISDIHANLTALEAVIAAAGEFDSTWCLGDLVGYGRIRTNASPACAGCRTCSA
jgi:predicted phosphodiesterase